MTFTQYKNTVRINHAKQLIRKGGLSMTEIAGQAGFSTIRTFNAAFKKRFSMTPSEYGRSMERSIPAEPSC